jgi:hypothetical protein
VVECRQRANDAHDGIGQISIIQWRIGEVLNLTYDVVPEKSHDASLKRRQFRYDWTSVDVEKRFNGRQHSLIPGHRRGNRSLNFNTSLAQGQCGPGVPAHEAESAPPFAVFYRFQEESRILSDQFRKGRHWCLKVGQNFYPHWDNRELAR